ncbi:MAG TPA: nickel-type superoxide dismutase maturation protease [Acidimicrobiia bacterium]|nr:nickel-type superoxide dismutase maturation protease [Acidimicrobiia bacterium]
MRRFRIAEESMLPTLRPGDIVLATTDRRPPAGSVVVFRHPRREDLWLVKRVTALGGDEMWVESDNPEATMADSRTLGWIPTELTYRARLRLRDRWRLSRV